MIIITTTNKKVLLHKDQQYFSICVATIPPPLNEIKHNHSHVVIVVLDPRYN